MVQLWSDKAAHLDIALQILVWSIAINVSYSGQFSNDF